MSGENSLRVLRASMSPLLHQDPFVYCCLSSIENLESLNPIGTFREAEGLTAIIPKECAEAIGISYQYECAMVTLTIHSSLEAVGFLAAVSAALANAEIPCNVVSAYYHDHLFVPFNQRNKAMQVLQGLSEKG